MVQKKKKIRFTRALMLATTILVMTGFTLLAVYAAGRMESIVLQNTEQDVAAAVRQADQALEQLWETIQRQGDSLVKNPNFIEAILLKKNGDTEYERQINELRVERELQNQYTGASHIENIIFYDEAGAYYGSGKNVAYYRDVLPRQEWMLPVLEGDTMSVSRYNVYPPGMAMPVHIFARRLYNSANGDYLGTLAVITDMDVFTDIVDGIFSGSGNTCVLLSASGVVEYSTGGKISADDLHIINTLRAGAQDGDSAAIKAESNYVFCEQASPQSPQAAALVSWDYLSRDARKIRLEMIAVSVVICGVIVVALGQTARYLTRPLVDMCREMDQVSRGRLDVSMEDQRYYETSLLVNHFNNMVEELQRLVEKVRQTEQEKQRVEMEVLEAQVNPHFIYNTLEAVKWMAIAQKSPNIPQVITALVKLLTMSISVKTKTVTVREELDYLKQYLLLMEFRFNNNYRVIYQIDPETQEAETVKMVLQPLVENAIFHGFSNQSGEIRITICARDGVLIMEVQDNGCGFDDTREKPPRRRSFTGVGTANIHSRIQLQYGEEYGLKLWSEPGKGTRVTIRQPLRYPEQGKDKEHDPGDDR